MKKNKICVILILLSINLTSCIALRSSDYQLEINKNIISGGMANQKEDNIGLEFPAQMLYLPMYSLYGGLSIIFSPFSKNFYKNDLATIIIDGGDHSNLDPTGDPSFFVIPKCHNNLLILAVGFMGKESELILKSDTGETIPKFFIKKDDIVLMIEKKIIKSNSIYLAGTEFNQITSRAALINYPIFRRKRIFYRFIEYPYSCKNFENEGATLILSKVFDYNNSVKGGAKFSLTKEFDKLYRVDLNFSDINKNIKNKKILETIDQKN